jgi:hypothetical protein
MQKIILSLITCFICLIANAQSDPTIACAQEIENKPELQIIKDKVALLDARKQTLEMLSNNAKPTKEEKSAISKWDTYLTQCIDIGREFRKSYRSPKQVAVIEENASEHKNLTAELYAGKLSYGSYAKARADLVKKMNVAMADANQDAIKASQAAQSANQDANRQQQLVDQQQQIINQQARQAQLQSQIQLLNTLKPAPINPPRQTNCVPNGFGGTSCTTY